MMQKRKEIIGSLITIGDEILLGDIPNGNAHYIASSLRAKGFRLRSMVTVGDEENDIIQTLNRHLKDSRFIIMTGGLGPTEDDRTNSAVSKAFDLPLVANRDYRESLRKKCAQRGLSWSEELDKLTELPEGAIKIGMGMAGFLIEHHDIPCYFLPGVPSEMRQLVTEVVIPDLELRFPNRPVYIKQILRIQGLRESAIGNRLKNLSFQDATIQLGYLPQPCENWVTLLITSEDERSATFRLQQAQKEIAARLGSEHISGLNDDSIETVVGRQLREKNWRMAAAESCTGGLVSSRITAIAGASDYFERAFITYSNEAKIEMLGVPPELLNQHGAVSEPVARAMAEGALKQAKVNVALAITGIAGPTGGSPDKPVGTVFVACSTLSHTQVEKHLFGGSREAVQEQSSQAALVLLWRVLLK